LPYEAQAANLLPAVTAELSDILHHTGVSLFALVSIFLFVAPNCIILVLLPWPRVRYVLRQVAYLDELLS